MRWERILGDGKLRDEDEYPEALASKEALLEEIDMQVPLHLKRI